MPPTAVASRLTSRIAFERAGRADDAAVRRLLREIPMDGDVQLTLEREPDASQAAGVEGERHHTLLARDTVTGDVVGLGSRAVRRVWVDGRPQRVGYLGQLRTAAVGGRIRTLSEAYRRLAATRRPDEAPYDLTSIVADNRRARRLLERGLPGMPSYTPVAEIVTLVLSTPRTARRGGSAVTAADPRDLAACIERHHRRHDFAPVLDAADLVCPRRSRGLTSEDMLVGRNAGRVVGTLALWDQRGFKQTVVRGYAPHIARWRRVLNVGLGLAGRPRLPEPGRPIALAYLAYLAVDGDRARQAIDLVQRGRRLARARGIDYVVLGLAADHPLLPPIQRSFPCRRYRSVLYLVQPPGVAPLARPRSRPPHVEVATL